MPDIIIRPGGPEEALPQPEEHIRLRASYFMEGDGKRAGMTLFYGHAAKNAGVVPFMILLIGILKLEFFLRLGNLLKFASVFAKTKEGDMYSGNSAVYPEFRGRGLGERLFSLSEEKARAGGYRRVVVDVKADNAAALALRTKLGYKVDEVLPAVKIGGKKFEYVRLVKEIRGRA
jgi:ribosomal protein S18 acetylase RimI-like enzyme